MISGSRERDFSTKQEGGFDVGHDTKRVCTSRAWPLLKDPRIVCVSRSLGKKDRHSKVSTIRGLRDRRVRLSVQTAIQLYDLQDRLGLNQPSKVVDWLLNAAQQEINELPPLPILQESYISQPQSIPSYHANLHQAASTFILDKNSDCFKDCGSHSLSMLSNNVNEKSNDVGIGEEQLGIPKNLYWNPEGSIRVKSKDANREMDIERSNWNKRFGQEARNPFHVLNNSSSPRSVSNALPYNSYLDRDSASASASHLGGHVHPFQIEELQHSNVVPVPSPISLSSGSQLLLCPSTVAPSTLLPFISNPLEYDSKQANHSQVLSINPPSLLPISLSTSIFPLGLAMRSLQVNMNQKHQHYQSSPEGQAKSLPRGNESNISSINVQMYGSKETLD